MTQQAEQAEKERAAETALPDAAPADAAAQPVYDGAKNAAPDDGVTALLKKQLLWTRIAALACVAVLLVAAVSAVVLVPRIAAAADAVTRVSDMLGGMDLSSLMDQIGSLAEAGQNSLGALDIEAFNQAVKDLQTALGPMVKLFG